MNDITPFRRKLLLAAVVSLAYLAPSEASAAAAERAGPEAVSGGFGVAVESAGVEALERCGVDAAVVITRVMPSSAAHTAGLRAGDLLAEVDGLPIDSPGRLAWLADRLRLPAVLPIRACSGDPCRCQSLIVDLDETVETASEPRENALQAGLLELARARVTSGMLGVRLTPTTAGLRHELGVPPDAGLLVYEVAEGSPAESAGIRAGDVLISVQAETLKSLADLSTAIPWEAQPSTVQVELVRAKAQQTVRLEVPAMSNLTASPAVASFAPLLIGLDWLLRLEDALDAQPR